MYIYYLFILECLSNDLTNLGSQNLKLLTQVVTIQNSFFVVVLNCLISGYVSGFKFLSHSIISIFFKNLPHKYSLIQYKGYNSKFKFFDGVQFRKYFISLPAFYLIIWLMKSPKNFEKTSILKI